MKLLQVIHAIMFAVLAVFYVWAWVRSRFWLPRYVHWLSGATFLLGCLMVCFIHGPGIAGIVKASVIPFMLSAIVYGVFVLYGGAHAAWTPMERRMEKESQPQVSQQTAEPDLHAGD